MLPSTLFSITKKKLFLLWLLFTPFLISSQVEIHTISSIKKNQFDWKKYSKKNGITIEYSFQENNIKSGYKSEYLVFRVTNNKKHSILVSWDFSANKISGKQINRSLSNSELSFEKIIPAKSYVTGNVNKFEKGSLVIFHQFTDPNYKGKNDLFTTNFKLHNLTIK